MRVVPAYRTGTVARRKWPRRVHRVGYQFAQVLCDIDGNRRSIHLGLVSDHVQVQSG